MSPRPEEGRGPLHVGTPPGQLYTGEVRKGWLAGMREAMRGDSLGSS